MERSLGEEGHDTVEEVKIKISELDELIADAGSWGRQGSSNRDRKRRSSLISQRKYYRKKLKMVTLIAEKNEWIARNEKVRANNARLTVLLRQAGDLVAQHIQVEAIHSNLRSTVSSLFSNRPLRIPDNYQQQSLALQQVAGLQGHHLHTQSLHQRASASTVPYLHQLNLLNLQASIDARCLPPYLTNISVSSLPLQHRIHLAHRLMGTASMRELLLEQAVYGNPDALSQLQNDPTRHPEGDNSHL